MTPERALGHDERCEGDVIAHNMYGQPLRTNERSYPCLCAERALTVSRQREEEAKGEIARLKTHVPCRAHTPSLPLPPATCCHVGDTITFWDEKFCDAVNEDEKIIAALRAENDRLTLAASESARTLQVEIERLKEYLRGTIRELDGHYYQCPGEGSHDRPEHDCVAIRRCGDIRAALAPSQESM